jgi:hypothetical protein
MASGSFRHPLVLAGSSAPIDITGNVVLLRWDRIRPQPEPPAAGAGGLPPELCEYNRSPAGFISHVGSCQVFSG